MAHLFGILMVELVAEQKVLLTTQQVAVVMEDYLRLVVAVLVLQVAVLVL
jgi:hypothetical protein